MSGSDGGVGGGGMDDAEEDPDSLRARTSEDFPWIGSAVNHQALGNEAQYDQTLQAEFNLVTAENAMKWMRLQPTQGTYVFDEADRLIAFANDARQAVRGHVLVWHNGLPDWVADLDAADLRAAMLDHIESVATHFRGQVVHWDVVNEAVRDNGTLRPSPFLEKLGPGYIKEAFEAARAADPDALLFYNDYGIATLGLKSDAVYELLSDLLAEGAPIDGLGIQGHVTAYDVLIGAVDEDSIRENIQRFAALGLKVMFTELDVRIADLALTPTERDIVQGEVYRLFADICRTEPGCDGIVTWGFTDKYSWIDQRYGPDDPLLYDESYVRKRAYEGVVAGMTGGAGTELFTLDTACTDIVGTALCDPFESVKAGSLYAAPDSGAAITGSELAYRGAGSLGASTPGGGAKAIGRRTVLSGATSGSLSVRAYVRVPSEVEIDRITILGLGSVQPSYVGINVSLTNEDRVQLSNNIAGQYPDSGATYQFPRDTWTCVVLDLDVAEQGSAAIRIDGVERVSQTGVATLPAGGYHEVKAGITGMSQAQGSASVLIDELVVSTQPLGCD